MKTLTIVFEITKLLVFPVIVGVAGAATWYFLKRHLDARNGMRDDESMLFAIDESLKKATATGSTDPQHRLIGIRIPNHTEHPIVIQEVAFVVTVAQRDEQPVEGRFQLDFINLSPARDDMFDFVMNPSGEPDLMRAQATSARKPVTLEPHTEGLWGHTAPKSATYLQGYDVHDWEITFLVTGTNKKPARRRVRSGQDAKVLYDALLKMN